MARRRSKKELEQVVVSFHQRILERLRQDEDIAIHQYKSLYFRIFREAYESGFCHPLSYNLHAKKDGFLRGWIFARPLVTGDSIWHYAKEQGWVHSQMKGDEPRYKQIEVVQTWWDEWTYAWIELMYKTRRHRIIEEPAADRRTPR